MKNDNKKEERLFQVMSHLDDELIEEAEEKHIIKRKPAAYIRKHWISWGMSAACLLLIAFMGASGFLDNLPFGSNTNSGESNSLAEDTTELYETTIATESNEPNSIENSEVTEQPNQSEASDQTGKPNQSSHSQSEKEDGIENYEEALIEQEDASEEQARHDFSTVSIEETLFVILDSSHGEVLEALELDEVITEQTIGECLGSLEDGSSYYLCVGYSQDRVVLLKSREGQWSYAVNYGLFSNIFS